MATKRIRMLAPYLLSNVFLAFTVLMLWYLDWIVNHILYHYNLSFSLDWATPYWTALRTILILIGLTIVTTTVTGYSSYKKAKKQTEKTIYLCKSCGNAWTEVDANVKVKEKLPKFKILKNCPSCNKRILDSKSTVLEEHIVDSPSEPTVSSRQ